MGNLAPPHLPLELASDYEYVVHEERAQNLRRLKCGNHHAELDKAALHGNMPGEIKMDSHLHGLVCNMTGQMLDGCSAGSGAAAKRTMAHVVPPPQVLDIVEKISKLVKVVGQEKVDVLDRDWNGLAGVRPLHFMLDSTNNEELTNTMLVLTEAAGLVLTADDTLTNVAPPAKVIGDIHGQFRDILLFFNDFGFPSLGDDTTFVFNGDFVDRGRHQLEVAVMVLALKVAYPDKVVLVRGNHEDPEMNINMGKVGFFAHCQDTLGAEMGLMVFRMIHSAFEWLPLGCVIAQQILVVHGGVGAGDWLLSYLRMTGRPLNHEALSDDPVLWNILWSDPLEDEVAGSFGVHSSPRDNHHQIMKTFGKDITAQFCSRNGLAMVVRSHQAKVMGKGYEVMHNGKLIRVFTARDYEGCQNDGCVLDIRRNDSLGKLVVKPQVLMSLTKSTRGFADGQVVFNALGQGAHEKGCIVQ